MEHYAKIVNTKIVSEKASSEMFDRALNAPLSDVHSVYGVEKFM